MLDAIIQIDRIVKQGVVVGQLLPFVDQPLVVYLHVQSKLNCDHNTKIYLKNTKIDLT